MPARTFSDTEIPEPWKHPHGPYRKAPDNFGGRWWIISPFTGEEPWATVAPASEILPEGFREIFFARPNPNDFHGQPNPSQAFRIAKTGWEQDLRLFKRAGVPEWVTGLEQLNAIYVYWGLGEVRFYEGRYGWMGAFPTAAARRYETAAYQVVNYPHLVVAQYQMRIIDEGRRPEQKHPFTPPHVIGELERPV